MPTFNNGAPSSLPSSSASSTRRQPKQGSSRSKKEDEAENQPLLSGINRIGRKRSNDSSSDFRNSPRIYYSFPEERGFFDYIMEKVKSSKVAHLVSRLAVESEPGLTNAQLMLHNFDLKPGKKFGCLPPVNFSVLTKSCSRTREKTVGSLEFRGLLDCRFFQHQHLDDLVFYDRFGRSLLVAIMAVRLDWLLYRRYLHLLDWSNWSDVSHFVPRRRSF